MKRLKIIIIRDASSESVDYIGSSGEESLEAFNKAKGTIKDGQIVELHHLQSPSRRYRKTDEKFDLTPSVPSLSPAEKAKGTPDEKGKEEPEQEKSKPAPADKAKGKK